MRTILCVATLGDEFTQPGGIELRLDDDDTFWVHDFALRGPGGERGKHYFNGGEASKLSEALDDFQRRVERAEEYTGGGALAPIREGLFEPSSAYTLINQIAHMTMAVEAPGQDLGNDDAMQGLIRRARAITGRA